MKADFTRDTFTLSSRRRTVRHQQGRVPLDAELNEAQDLLITRVETGARDVIGPAGAPQDQAGFAMTVDAGGNVVAGAGRYYVDGILCQLDAATPVNAQPDLPGYTLPTEDGLYVAGLFVSFDHLTALEDPSIQEVALHGADTTTRQRVKPQVRLIRVNEDPNAAATCETAFPAWDAETAAPTGTAAARAEPEELPENECSMTPGAGYRNLLNQLYRVEIHAAGDETEATYKWSRENGSIVALWQSKTGNDLTVSHQGRDPHRLFRANGWVELIDRERELRDEPGTLVRVTNVRGNVLTIDPASATGTVDLADFQTLPRVRRWESAGALPLNHAPDADGFSPLEYGVQVRFGDGTYRTGDYWLIPARAATGDVEWRKDPATNEPLLLPRHGAAQHHARLALLRHTGGTWSVVADCRKLFPPLTELDKTDLKLHNKHLHGSGVVCGLQVCCDGPDRVRVRIRTGHAIDCEGTDILLQEEHPLGVVEMAGGQQLLDANGNGEVLVTLVADAADHPVFGVRAAPAGDNSATGILRQILEGTLWWDFYHDCLKPLVSFLRDFLAAPASGTTGGLVSVQQQRLLTLANLLAHRRTAAADRRLWLSAEQHDMLQQLYEGLREFAGSSKTFCGISTTFPALPAYPFANRPIRTAFAARALSGVRSVAVGEREFVLAWSDNEPGRLFVFDPANGQMTHNLAVPGAAAFAVRDVTVAQLGNDNVAVVAAANANQTVLSLLRVGAFTSAANPFVLQGGTLTRLETHSRSPSTVLALQPGEGIHFFDLNRLSSQTLPAPAWRFNAAGHVSVVEDAVCATVRVSTATPAGSYDALRFGRLSRDGNPVEERDTRLNEIEDTFTTGEDGIVLVPSANGLLVHVLGNPAATGQPKRILVMDAVAKRRVSVMTLPLAEGGAAGTGAVRLATVPAQSRVVYALAERNQLVWANATGSGALSTTTIPAQSEPVAVALSGRGAQLIAVAHGESMTVTLVPVASLEQAAITDAQLAAYRDALIAAFESLVVAIAQSLKDCLCDRLLRDCPQCGEDEFLTLAKVEIRGRQVYHICNFDRDEVLTFPKVSYWLSAVPILPAVRFLVEKFCCWVIPTPESRASTGTANALVTTALMKMATPGSFEKFSEAISDQFAWAKSLGRLAADKTVSSAAARGPTTRAPRARAASVLGRSPQNATAELADAGVSVERVAPYEELLARDEPLIGADLSRTLAPGERVELFTRGNEVAFVRRVRETETEEPTPGATPAGTAPTGVTRPDGSIDATVIANIRREIEDLKASHASELAARDAAITAVRSVQAAESAARAAEITALKQAAEVERAAHSAALAELRSANVNLQQRLTEADAALRNELASTRDTLRREITRITPAPTPPRPRRPER